jgi:hypothetical protein
MNERSRNVVIVLATTSHFREMFALALCLAASVSLKPRMLFLGNYAGSDDDKATLSSNGVEWCDATAFLRDEAEALHTPVWLRARLSWLKPFLGAALGLICGSFALVVGKRLTCAGVRRRSWLARLILRAFSVVWTRYPYLLPAYSRRAYCLRKRVAELVGRLGAEVLILPEDNLILLTPIFVNAVHERGGKALVFPFTVANHREWAEVFGSDPAFRPGPLRRLLLRYTFPEWAIEYRGHVLAFPLVYPLTNELLGTSPRAPWVLNSGRADKIVVESEFLQQYCVQAGIETDRLLALGAPYQDSLHRAIQGAGKERARLLKGRASNELTKVLLISAPPDNFVGSRSANLEFVDHHELLEFMISTASSVPGTLVLVSPHPRLAAGSLPVEGLANVLVRTEPVYELLPLCDIFVACASATIRMAIAARKPVLNFDAYQYGYDDFTGIPGIFHASSREEFARMVRNLARDDDTYTAAAQGMSSYAQRMSPIDGKAVERITQYIERA